MSIASPAPFLFARPCSRQLTVATTALVAALALVTAAGCGDSGNTTSNGGSGGGADCPNNLTPAANDEFCASNPATIDCTLVTSDKYQLCGVALKQPPGELARSQNVIEFAGSGPPDVSCFQPANYPAQPGTPQDVTVKGFARIFSGGCDSHDLKITFFRVQPSGQLGDPISTAVVTPATCVNVGEASDVDDCDTRWECSYTYTGVPTETEIAIRTENGPSGAIWAPLIQYNIYIPNSEVVNGEWEHDVRALTADDYSVIPQTAIGHPITPGNGAVAGEVHDCGDVRVENAVADIDQPKAITTYFTSNEDSPLPDLAAKGTSVLGLYAALDVPAGPVTVSAGGFVNGEFVALGQHRVWVYENAVSTVTFKGLQPYQVK